MWNKSIYTKTFVEKNIKIAKAILVAFLTTFLLTCNIGKSVGSEKEAVTDNFQKLKIQSTPPLNNFNVIIEQAKNDDISDDKNNVAILLTLENGNNYPINFITNSCYPFEEIDENEFKIMKIFSCNATFKIIRTLRPKERLTKRLYLKLKTGVTKLTFIMNLQPTFEKATILSSNLSDYRLEPILKKRSNQIQLVPQH